MRRVASELRAGRPVILPTETFYALCADASREDAVERVLRLKGRPPDKPIPVVIMNERALDHLAAHVPDGARRLMDRFWPGALTLVLEAAEGVQPGLLAGGKTLGVRVPGHRFLLRVLEEVGFPLTATSANRSGADSPVSAAEATAAFEGENLLAIDGGKTPGGRPSTVVDVSRRPYRLIRDGIIPIEAIIAAAGEEVLR